MNFHYTFPPFHQERLKNGLTVVWVPHHEQNVFTIAFQSRAGKFDDAPGREGTTELAAGLMQKGTRDLEPEHLAEKLEFSGASLYSDVGDEHLLFGCRMLAKYADTIIPLFWDVITRPGLRPKELTRLKKEMTTALQAELIDPGSIAHKHFYAELCGKNLPGGRGATIKSVKKITLDTVRSFIDTHVVPEGSTLIVAGDAGVEGMKSRWEPLFSSWDASGQKRPSAQIRLSNPEKTVIRLIDKPDLSQTSIIIGHPAPGEADEEREPLAIANYILGGGNFSSRLMAQIRGAHGSTYNISSQLTCNRQFGIFSIATSTQNTKVKDVLHTILEAYDKLSRDGVTEEELEKAKQFAVGNMAFQLEGIGNITEKLLWLRFYGRKQAYIENFADRITQLNTEKINAVISKHLSYKNFICAAVGKKTEIFEQLKEFGLVKPMHFRANP
ncbi:MAG: hypothetical protein GF401_07980 [Chitinivibrionales bacterium]|nr:hypothetical protein [Chitinivibrionales bacterium]